MTSFLIGFFWTFALGTGLRAFLSEVGGGREVLLTVGPGVLVPGLALSEVKNFGVFFTCGVKGMGGRLVRTGVERRRDDWIPKDGPIGVDGTLRKL